MGQLSSVVLGLNLVKNSFSQFRTNSLDNSDSDISGFSFGGSQDPIQEPEAKKPNLRQKPNTKPKAKSESKNELEKASNKKGENLVAEIAK